MTSLAPGSYTYVTEAPPSPNGAVATGTWFITGETYSGPTGVAIPITSLTDYLNFCGQRVSYGFLYDSLDEYFHDGGVIAYVSRVVGPGAAAAAITVPDRADSPTNTLTFTAAGAGAWGNATNGGLSVVVANSTNNGDAYTLQILLNGVQIGQISPNLFVPQDAVNWLAAQSPWVYMVTCANLGADDAAPTNNPAVGTYQLTGGSDDVSGVTETQWTNALAVFTEDLGPGQVSAPGHTTAQGYVSLNAHAVANNRVPVMDVADSDSVSTLTSQSSGFQASVTDPSYGSLYAPWLILPGINTAASSSSSPILNRVVPPSALAAARMAANDQSNDCNKAAAGPSGQSTYAVNVTQTYTDADRLTLNTAGINVVRMIQGTPTVYGTQSLALDPNWTQLNWVRMRMQMIYDFNEIGEGFAFGEIDGTGQLFSQFNGALAGQCQQYWVNGSIYGATVNDAFTVNTGPQVNTSATIAAGQINAQVLVVFSPSAPVVVINVVKYLTSTPLPTTV